MGLASQKRTRLLRNFDSCLKLHAKNCRVHFMCADQSTELEKSFSGEEIKAAGDGLGANKALGPDGFTGELLKNLGT